MTPADDLDSGYRTMAADAEREAEAQAWCGSLKVPNAETRAAMAEADAIAAAHSARFTSAEELFRELDAYAASVNTQKSVKA